MLSRRAALGLISSGPLLTIIGKSAAQPSPSPDNQHDMENKIKAWIADQANNDYFEIPGKPGKGSLRLPPTDVRVKEAAAFLSKVPQNLRPSETARYILEHLPEGKRMEWPQDNPGNPQAANPLIVAFFAATDTEPLDGDQTAWCAAFACWTLQRAGLKHPHNAGARAFRSWQQSTDNPELGDLVVFKNKSNPTRGHVAYFDGFANESKTKVFALGGNQRDRLSRVEFPLETNSLKLHSFRTAPGLRG